MKSSPPETLVHAVRQVLEGQVYLSPSMSGQLLDRLSRSPSKSNVSLSPHGAADGQGIGNPYVDWASQNIHGNIQTVEYQC